MRSAPRPFFLLKKEAASSPRHPLLFVLSRAFSPTGKLTAPDSPRPPLNPGSAQWAAELLGQA